MGKLGDSAALMRTTRLNILPRTRIVYALCGLWIVMAQIRHRPQMKKPLRNAKA